MKRTPGKPNNRSETKSSGIEGLFFVEGASAVQEYARFKPVSIRSIRYKTSAAKDVDRIVGHLEHDIETETVDDLISPIVAKVQHTAIDDDELFSRCQSRKRDLIVALDQVTDPRNLGAIVRSCAFFGVTEILVPGRRQTLLTQAAVSTAQGGFALTDLAVCVNLGRALEGLKKQGYWIMGTDMDSPSFEKVKNQYEKLVLVLGSEGKGLSDGIRKKCDLLVSIGGAHRGVESLNVAVASGILLYALQSNASNDR